ncbi:hypothetical protein AYI70_g9001 [Smittium culicis]|uniref:Uncharacterized protein n=1 Tax=Smittium culicis TaxID=133412 RepID=A0A1R1XDC5_9FUNG|nr:hypothetical protein AYI70_g9001 [Smittium culicis]
MERSEFPPRNPGSESLHRCERITLGDIHWPEPVLRNVEQSTAQSSYQFQGAASNLKGYQDVSVNGQERGCILRQQYLRQLSPFLSRPKEPADFSANQDTTVSSHPIPEKQKISDNVQQYMVIYYLEIKRVRYQEADQAEKIFEPEDQVPTVDF